MTTEATIVDFKDAKVGDTVLMHFHARRLKWEAGTVDEADSVEIRVGRLLFSRATGIGIARNRVGKYHSRYCFLAHATPEEIEAYRAQVESGLSEEDLIRAEQTQEESARLAYLLRTVAKITKTHASDPMAAAKLLADVAFNITDGHDWSK